MRATEFTRDDCLLGEGKRVTYRALVREFRCDACGGRPVTRCSDDGWFACCGACGGQEFVHEAELARQKAEAIEVLAGLPADLRQLVRQ
jgi:hypothetical protein